ncbi:MAG TPA: hypothetical protein VHV47_08735, partial [Opitutaceae bacterium]|nr:hypothetical protein [Opitutaceae bacterium]
MPSALTGWIGLLGFLGGVLALNRWGPVYQLARYWEGLLVLACTALPMIGCDLLQLRRRARHGPVDGVTRQRDHSLGRTAVKLVGLAATVALLALAYWIFPEYHPSLTPEHGFYNNFFLLCRRAGPWSVPVCAAYFWVVDARLQDPHDGYWHFGRLALLKFTGVDAGKVKQHLRTWAVKGFFLPLMFALFCNNLPGLYYRGWPDFMVAHDYLHNVLFTVDLAFV